MNAQSISELTANGALTAIDWRTIAALLGIITATMLLIYWNKRQDGYRGAAWLNHAALSLELLGLALSLFWAVRAPDGAILPWIFCAGWIGMLVGRAVLIAFVVNAWQQRHFSKAAFGILTLLIAYVTLYGSGLFHAVNDAGEAAQQRLEASKPAQALDAEIEATRRNISQLAGFADADKAHSETLAIQSAQNAYHSRRSQILQELAAERAKLAECPTNYITKCIKPARAEIARLQTELTTIGDGVGGSDYASKHEQYNGLQLHLVELQKQRAALSENGQGVKSAWKPEDRMLAWLLGISPETASNIKWLLFTAIFDILSLLFRIWASIQLGKADPETLQRRKLEALLNGGFDMQQALSIMGGAGNFIPPAQISKPHIQSADTGARIDTDGILNVHAGEAVLNAEAVAILDKRHPGLIDQLNAIGAAKPGVANNIATANNTGTTNTVTTIYKDRERVPAELSGRQGRGRVGKIDTCKDCGADFEVLAHNGTRCPACAQSAEASHARRLSRKKS